MDSILEELDPITLAEICCYCVDIEFSTCDSCIINKIEAELSKIN